MSAEHRENRPFKSVPELDALLDDLKLHAGDFVIGPDTTRAVDQEVFARSPFVLRLAPDEARFHQSIERALSALADSPYEPDELALVVVASSSYLKILEVLAVLPLAELQDAPLSLSLTAPQRPRAMQVPRSGCEVEVAICLSREREFKPLQAWRRWTWLSRVRFGVETEVTFGGFTPLPLDSEKREEFSLPAGTMRYVVVDSEVSVASPSFSEDSVQLYVDAELLALMSANDRSANSALLQRVLFVDAIWAVVNQASQQRDEIDGLTPEDIRGSLLDKVIRMATGPAPTAAALAATLDLVREQPAAFMARIEHAAELLGGAHDVAGGSQ